MVSRRNFLQGAGAFFATASAYQQTSAGILMPTDELITPEPVGTNILFDGYPVSFDLESHIDQIPLTSINFEGDVVEYSKSRLGMTVESDQLNEKIESLIFRPRVRIIVCLYE